MSEYPGECAYCGVDVELPVIQRAGEWVCDECAKRLRPCPNCASTGKKFAKPNTRMLTYNTCPACGGSGINAPLDTCFYAGRRYCDNRGCAGCRERRERFAEQYDRTEVSE